MASIVANDIEWISYLDRMYIQEAKGTNNKDYYYYPKVQITMCTKNVNMIIRKKTDKTQFLFSDMYGRKLYLSDVDIIKIIVGSTNEIYNILLEILLLYIENLITEDVNFIINDETFCYKSICLSNYDAGKLNILKSATFDSESDIIITYADLLTLINLIICKEYLVDNLRGDTRVLKQAKKFYVLCRVEKDKLKNRTPFKSEELQKLGFSTLKSIEDIYYNNKIAKEIDNIFLEIDL